MEGKDSFDFSDLVGKLRKSYKDGAMRSYKARIAQLKQLDLMITEHEDELYDASYKDLHKCKFETDIMEVSQVKIECRNAINNLSNWMKPKRVTPDIVNKMNTCELRADPLGVVLVISAWNYPIQLTLLPLVGALAAGNCIVVKPSELAPHTSAVMTKLLTEYMSQDVLRVVEGGIPETTALLRERYDLIFYTGSPPVAKIIMQAAAKHLTPTVLELGGKCPAIIDESCDMDTIAQRICWAKFVNCGQTCLAVDYVLCIGNCQSEFIDAMKRAVVKFYGENPKESQSYGRIINQRHFQRILKLIDPSKVVFGNETDENDLYISPTVLANVSGEDTVMQQENEIFGPLLPVVNVKNVEEAIEFVNDREKPLALYVFSKNYALTQKVANETSSGGIGINDAVIHAGVPNLPFGGVGNSGMGSYHGKASFKVFSHIKSYLYKSPGLESANTIRYPPYDNDWYIFKWIKWLITPSIKY